MTLICSEIILSNSQQQEEVFTAFQLECSQIIQNVFTEATDCLGILSLAGGGWVSQFSRLSCLKSISQFSRNQSIRRIVPSICATAVEGTFFHGFSTWRKGEFSLLEFGKGSLHSSFILAGCKIAGKIAPSNFILTQLFQCFAIVEINEACGGILVEKEMGSFMEKMFRAGGTSFPILFSGQLLAICSPGHLQRQARYNLEIELHTGSAKGSSGKTSSILSLFDFECVTPEGNRLRTPLSVVSESKETDLGRGKRSHILMMVGGKREGGEKPLSTSNEETTRRVEREEPKGLIEVSRDDETYIAQRKIMNSLGSRCSYERESLSRQIDAVAQSHRVDPPFVNFPNDPYRELRAIAGALLERSIYPQIRSWNERNGYPLAHLISPTELEIVDHIHDIYMPLYKRRRRMFHPIDNLYAAMNDIFFHHIEVWDQKVQLQATNPDFPSERDRYERFKQVAKMTYLNGNELVMPEQTQTPKDFLHLNMNVGLMLGWSLIDLIPNIYNYQFGRPPNRATLVEIIQSGIDDVYLDLARLPLNVIQILEKSAFDPAIQAGMVSEIPRAVGPVISRLPFAPGHFQLYKTRAGLRLYFKNDFLSWFSEEIGPYLEKAVVTKGLIHTGCVALAAKTGSNPILKDLLGWMKLWSIHYFAPFLGE